jgi:protein disulfide-isomerase A1
MKLAYILDNIPFAVIYDAVVATEANLTENTIVMFKKFDDGRADYNGMSDVYELQKWVQSNRLPLVLEFKYA